MEQTVIKTYVKANFPDPGRAPNLLRAVTKKTPSNKRLTIMKCLLTQNI